MELDAHETEDRGSKLDAGRTQLPNHEIDGVHHFGAELKGRDGGSIYEMAAKERAASEMISSHTAVPSQSLPIS